VRWISDRPGKGFVLGRPDVEFDQFYQAHRAEVFSTAYLITADREEARDLTQETFVRAFQHWRELSGHERPGAWLQTVVARLAISWRRRQALRLKLAIGHGVTAAEGMIQTDEPVVLQALRALTPAQRTVVVLRFYADRSVEDVAHTLGKRPGTVKALTAQAFDRLRPVLEARGVQP
jgi:RNA polymerase sigma-70 factor, ECF subfamily